MESSLRDESRDKAFFEQLKSMGVPVCNAKMALNVKKYEETTHNIPDDSWGRRFKAKARRYFGLDDG